MKEMNPAETRETEIKDDTTLKRSGFFMGGETSFQDGYSRGLLGSGCVAASLLVKCNKCGIKKEITSFHKQKGSKYGIRKICKLCCNEKKREEYCLNIDASRVRNKLKRDRQKKKNLTLYKEKTRIWHDNNRFNGNRVAVLKRDNYQCQSCGTKQNLHVHHKDGKGRNVEKSNNDIDNLITLCKSCHSKLHYKNNKLKNISSGRVPTNFLISAERPIMYRSGRVQSLPFLSHKILILCLSFLLVSNLAFSQINLDVIKQIESSGNPFAYNEGSQARGLYQITPICLKDYLQYHKEKVTEHDLFNPVINERIARWYLCVRIPQLLKHYTQTITLENILISYNAGIDYVVKGKSLPAETRNYIKKYKKLKGGE